MLRQDFESTRREQRWHLDPNAKARASSNSAAPARPACREKGEWQVSYVFISSTFRDMHGERDALTQVVFPALNERCRSRRVTLVPIDLRWGLTLEQCRTTGALELCLSEIGTVDANETHALPTTFKLLPQPWII